jgi:hypothetical protein
MTFGKGIGCVLQAVETIPNSLVEFTTSTRVVPLVFKVLDKIFKAYEVYEVELAFLVVDGGNNVKDILKNVAIERIRKAVVLVGGDLPSHFGFKGEGGRSSGVTASLIYLFICKTFAFH